MPAASDSPLERGLLVERQQYERQRLTMHTRQRERLVGVGVERLHARHLAAGESAREHEDVEVGSSDEQAIGYGGVDPDI